MGSFCAARAQNFLMLHLESPRAGKPSISWVAFETWQPMQRPIELFLAEATCRAAGAKDNVRFSEGGSEPLSWNREVP